MALNINDSNYPELLASGKPMVIDFWATWCGPCKRMAPIIEELAKEHPNINIGKCNVEESEDLASQFRVTSIPTLVFINSSGQPAGRMVGAQSKARVEEEIAKLT